MWRKMRVTVRLGMVLLVLGTVLALGSGNEHLSTIASTPSTESANSSSAAEKTCIECHTSSAVLEELAVEEPVVEEAGGCGAPPPNIPKSEKLLVSEDFLNDIHSKMGCVACHQGQDSGDVATAHVGIVRDPSVDGEACKGCHKDIVSRYDTALHNTLQGQISAVEARSHPGIMVQELAEVNEVDCSTCHTTCGQCHVSRPDPAKGGLIDGHLFLGESSMKEVCVRCHGTSKEGGLYLADYGVGDVHWVQGKMTCMDCHKGEELHGSGTVYANRYEVRELPRCTDCHDLDKIAGAKSHTIHEDKLSCYVCHSAGPVETCLGCHEGYEDGKRYRTSEKIDYIFKIGLNSNPSDAYPYKYVTVRKVPTVRDTFSYFGVELSRFDEVPTWKMSTPHNIRKKTPQNGSCDSCHGHPELFLTKEDLGPSASDKDLDVVVSSPPQ